MLASDEIERERSPDQIRTGDALIDIDHDDARPLSLRSKSPSPLREDLTLHRRMTLRAEDDVCFPQEGLSDLAEEDFQRQADQASYRVRRRRSRKWPDLSFLEEWAIEEKEQRTLEGIRARQVSEPLMVGGRLRPSKTAWHRQEDDNPFHFTYFNEEFDNTIHAQSISELLQPGQNFKDLFVPEPPLLSDDSSEDEDIPPQHISDNMSDRRTSVRSPASAATPSRKDTTTKSSRLSEHPRQSTPGQNTGQNTPLQQPVKPKRYGPRPVFWLDVLCPTDGEMKVLSKTFGIHPLTAEDIMMQEAREKVELFRNYYFVNYRSFEQDTNSDSYMAPVNMYVIVFREGVISFHFSQTPHPANVRRRIRQLSDYLFLTTDWISYAIIDDVTDAYAPLIERIEEEVDDIDEAILTLHSEPESSSSDDNAWKRWRDKFLEYEKRSTHSDDEKDKEKDKMTANTGEYMLRRVGETRKKVMSLYRLLGNKADVIKGFAKRCNEQWDIAPRSEIGLYLGDIQDHIVTMTGNLSHYENLLSRAHGNYLAQINLTMNSRAEKTNDVLNKLTVLGTIVLPMNIVTGMWGMNVLVPVSLHPLNTFYRVMSY
jgi:magnesium transporter